MAWSGVPLAPPDPIFGLAQLCRQDQDPKKIDLGIGAYRGENGKPYLLNIVQKVEQELSDSKLDKEYLPIDGLQSFREAAVKLLLGENSPAIKEKRVASAQSISGTGCLRLAAEFYKKFLGPDKPVYLSKPTWGNHKNVFGFAGMYDIREYRYFHKETKGVDFDGMVEDLQNAPDGSVIVLHGCAHNPTGADPSKEQWEQLAQLAKAKKHYIFFDVAYQGYATGDLEGDAYGIRCFERNGLEFATAQSFAKNMGLYSERVGCVSFVCSTPQEAINVNSQLKVIIRPMYSNPPIHGARIASRILNEPQLFEEWKAELKEMSGRIVRMRQLLVDGLKERGTPGDWSHIVKQIGMFSYTGLTAPQCEALITKYHIYLPSDGRISIAGLNLSNISYMCDAVHDVVTSL